MKTAKTAREEYVAFRLNEWARWLRSDNKLLSHLHCQSWLGVMQRQYDNYSGNHPNQDECEKVQTVFINLEVSHKNDAQCVYFYYVTDISAKCAAEKIGISGDTFGARRRAGELFISGGLG